MKARAAVAGLALLLCASSPRPLIIDRMLAFETVQTRGVIGYRSTLVSESKMFFGPAIHTTVVAGYVSVDGKAVEARLYSVTENGRALTGALRAKLDDGLQRDIRAAHKSPLLLRDASEYRYSIASDCSDCAAGEMKVHFVTRVRDAAHVNGDMWIDASSGRPVRMTSAPAVSPSFLIASATTSAFASVAPNIWGISQQTVHAQVKRFFLTVDTNGVASFTNFHRFANVAAAHAALIRGM